MKSTIFAVLICGVALFQTKGADEPLIPPTLNKVLLKIRPGMTIHEVEAVLSTSYAKVSGQMSDWSGMTGYIGYKLDDRYSLSISSVNRKDGEKVVQVVQGDLLFYIYDWPAKRRVGIKQYDWDKQMPKSEVNRNLTKYISDILTECKKITPGMTRADLLKVFTTEGGISTATHRTFVHRRCSIIKVDVEFALSQPRKPEGGSPRPSRSAGTRSRSGR
jgi:hypothetical protein